MFNKGTTALLEALPSWEGLDPDATRRTLSAAYLDVLEIRDAFARETGPPSAEVRDTLRSLVTALELYAILAPGLSAEGVRASAFIAAEALELATQLPGADFEFPTASTDDEDLPEEPDPAPRRIFGNLDLYERVEAGLLFMIAGFDANAGISARGVEEPDDDEGVAELEWERFALRSIRRFLEVQGPEPADPGAGEIPTELDTVSRLRAHVWYRITELLDAHMAWLKLESEETESPAPEGLSQLSALLVGEGDTSYGDLAHLTTLLAAAVEMTRLRALRLVPAPEGAESWSDYVNRRAKQRPLLWPSAEPFVTACLPGPTRHAAVAVPTGAGKGFIAELGIAQALQHGWVLYLAPTNALVGQVQRDLRRNLRGIDGLEVRAFLGGAEYLELDDEVAETVERGTVLVMTPEKCSLALRQAPTAFEQLALCVFDECHLIADIGGRGVLAELVAAHVLALAPQTRMLLLSALVSNPEDLSTWLEGTTGIEAVPIENPWRPTRTLRAILGYDASRIGPVQAAATVALEDLPASRVNVGFEAPLALMANLQGPWADPDPAEYSFVRLPQTAPLRMTRRATGIRLNTGGYLNVTAAVLAEALSQSGERVLAFVPKNRHHSFGVAERIQNTPAGLELADEETRGTIEANLDLARYELGTETALSELLERGVAVHTSALLPTERRASELAYESGIAAVMVATGTLAQGLNLPATAVLIAGTEVGYQPRLTAVQQRERARTQLLNAVGRAGRPGVANRSIAIVLPNRAFELQSTTAPEAVRQAASFLRDEDASTGINSQLDRLVSNALDGSVAIGTMSEDEMVAFSYLPSEASETPGKEILQRSYGVWMREAASGEALDLLDSTLGALGRTFVEEADVPSWLPDVSYRSGLTLPQVFALHAAVLELDDSSRPESFEDWMRFTVAVLARVPLLFAAEMLDQDQFPDSLVFQPIWEEDVDPSDAWDAFANTTAAFMRGDTIDALAQDSMPDPRPGDARRTSGSLPIPKLLTLVQQTFAYQLSRVAGGVVALFKVASEETNEPRWHLTDEAQAALDAFPLAVHYGCHDHSSLAWFRFGVRHRRPAHLFSRLFPVPGGLSEQQEQTWVVETRDRWAEGAADLQTAQLDEADEKALAAVRWLNATGS